MDDDSTQKPPRPEWLRPEILMPVLGILLVGLILGSFLVMKSIKKEHRIYRPTEFGPMDRRPAPLVVQTNQTTNAPGPASDNETQPASAPE